MHNWEIYIFQFFGLLSSYLLFEKDEFKQHPFIYIGLVKQIFVLYCYIHNVSADFSFGLLQVFYGPGSNGNKGILCIPQSSSITGASLSDLFSCHIQGQLLLGGVLSLCREAVGVLTVSVH